MEKLVLYHYARLLFDSGGVGRRRRQLRDPAHFFECLYRRFRKNFAASTASAMALHDHHEVKIPPFEDIAHILRVLYDSACGNS